MVTWGRYLLLILLLVSLGATLLIAHTAIRRTIIIPFDTIIDSIRALIDRIKSNTMHPTEKISVDTMPASEIGLMVEALNALLAKNAEYYQRLTENRELALLGKITAQVSHDIRSPLAALEVATASLAALPEDQRLLIRGATTRIRDIANNLITQSRTSQTTTTQTASTEEERSVELLSSLLDPLITEKRLQFRVRRAVEIQAEFGEAAYGLFANVQPTEFKRMLSNLVNNAVESLADKGIVRVQLQPCDGAVCIEVRDTGKGIPPDVLPKLTERGATFGKAGGSGLGLFHAREQAEAWGGTLMIASEVGKGTTVTLRLPAAEPPAWFVPMLHLQDGMTVVVLDDDQSIHDIWQGRLEGLRSQLPQLTVLHFSTAEETLAWHTEVYLPQPPPYKGGGKDDVLYLVDYELLGQPSNGLALIEHLQIAPHAILVTSRYEDPAIRAKCAELGVRLIPKGLAGFVPIVGNPLCEVPGARCEVPAVDPALRTSDPALPTGYRVLLIDDDDTIGLCWRIAKRQLQIRELVYVPNLKAVHAQRIDVTVFDVVFVDKNIAGSAHDGVATIAYLREHGAQRIVLASGERADDLRTDPQFATVDGICAEKIPSSLAPYLMTQ